MFILDYWDFDALFQSLFSVVLSTMMLVFLVALLASGAVLLFNEIFGYTTYPEEKRKEDTDE